jgi:hypothetical protein
LSLSWNEQVRIDNGEEPIWGRIDYENNRCCLGVDYENQFGGIDYENQFGGMNYEKNQFGEESIAILGMKSTRRINILY